MNANATSNQTLRDIIVLFLGAGLATSVLLVLYFVLPLGKSDSKLVSDDDTPTMSESVEQNALSPSRANQTRGTYDIDSLADILTNYSGSFDRFAALYSLTSESDEEQLVALFNESLTYEYGELDESWLQSSIQRTILSRLIHVNYRLASSVFRSLANEQQSAISYTFAREWASFDLDGAVNFVDSLEDYSVQFSATQGILDLNKTLPPEELMTLAARLGDTKHVQRLLEQDLLQNEAENPAEAWATLSADPDLLTDENWSRIDNIVTAWIKEDGVVVLDTVTEAIKDKNLKERINRRGLDTLVEHHPEEAFDIALQLEFVGNTPFWEPPNNAFKNFVLNAWVRESPIDALNRVLTIGSDSRRNDYIVDVFRSWARSDIQGMVESIPQFPSEIQDSARVSGIFHLSRESIDEALSLFDDIEGDAKKSLAAMSIATSWAEKHPEGALRWAQTKLNTESIRTQVTSTMLMFLAGQDPQRAFDVALRLPINKDSVGLEASVIATLAYTNVDEALEILHKVRRGASLKTAYMSVGRGLAMQGRISEAIELGNELPDEDQVNYYTTVGTMSLYGSLVSGITGKKPEKDVFEILDSIPHEGARSKVAVQAILLDKMSDSFSDEEIETLKKYVSEKDMEELEQGLEQMESMPLPFLGL